MSAPKGNRYAAKPARERRESRLNRIDREVMRQFLVPESA